MTRSQGGVNATELTIRIYLIDNYTASGDTPLTRELADELIAKHRDIVDPAIRLRSHAYYPGDQIADAETLTPIPEPNYSCVCDSCGDQWTEDEPPAICPECGSLAARPSTRPTMSQSPNRPWHSDT